MTRLIEIQGIGPAFEAKLKKAGVKSIEDLLEKGGTPEGRKTLAAKSRLGGTRILRWVNHADLYRIKGVAGQYAELLEAAGVDTVVELARRNAENLARQLEEANTAKKRVEVVPTADQIGQWVEEAKALPRKISY